MLFGPRERSDFFLVHGVPLRINIDSAGFTVPSVGSVREKVNSWGIFYFLLLSLFPQQSLSKTPVLPVLSTGFFTVYSMVMNKSDEVARAVHKCDHPYIRKGYYLGLDPEEYVCMCCEEQLKPEQWEDFASRLTPPAGMLNGPKRHQPLAVIGRC